MVQVGKLRFKEMISEQKIMQRVSELGNEMSQLYKDENPIFIAVLNGSFIFMGDLFKNIDIQCEVSFIKVQSYNNTDSTGKITELIGLKENLENRHVVIVEDIIETGLTLSNVREKIMSQMPKSLKICTLLYKPTEFKYNYPIDFIGFTIENDFVVGYGLDYNGQGRNLNAIYVKH